MMMRGGGPLGVYRNDSDWWELDDLGGLDPTRSLSFQILERRGSKLHILMHGEPA